MKEFSEQFEVQSMASAAVLMQARTVEPTPACYVGLDVHKDTIAVALAWPGRAAPEYLGDISHFASPKELMGYLGLVPSVHDSGLATGRRGSITRMGNTHARRILVEAAWSYRHPARQTEHLVRKAKAASPEARTIAWRAQKRLCGRYRTLVGAGKNTKVACVAVARERVGFVWDIVRHEMPKLHGA
jgi:hypothetical protein